MHHFSKIDLVFPFRGLLFKYFPVYFFFFTLIFNIFHFLKNLLTFTYAVWESLIKSNVFLCNNYHFFPSWTISWIRLEFQSWYTGLKSSIYQVVGSSSYMTGDNMRKEWFEHTINKLLNQEKKETRKSIRKWSWSIKIVAFQVEYVNK